MGLARSLRQAGLDRTSSQLVDADAEELAVALANQHDQHHAAPTDLIGTPIWLSFVVIAAVVFWPSWHLFGLGIASGFTAGVVTGYVGYSFVHHVLHHWHPPHGSYLYTVKRRHALHHHNDVEGNFGVTTLFWDHVFGTAIPDRPGQAARARR